MGTSHGRVGTSRLGSARVRLGFGGTTKSKLEGCRRSKIREDEEANEEESVEYFADDHGLLG